MWPCIYAASYVYGAAAGLRSRLVGCRLDAIKPPSLSTDACLGRAVSATHSSEKRCERNLPNEMVGGSSDSLGARIGYDIRRDIAFYTRPGVPARALK
jgi:hypothetical protein